MYYTPEEVTACIVTCGGLCPGLNTVIRELVCGLDYMYGVKNVLGIQVSFLLQTIHIMMPRNMVFFFLLVFLRGFIVEFDGF